MYNYYDFEAEHPRDKAAYKFLLSDYFHDGEIRCVNYDNKKRKLEICIRRSCEAEKTKTGNRDDTERIYLLAFSGVAGYRAFTSGDIQPTEFINGRFKKTAWLDERQEETEQKLYQFRIGLSDGYIDILFTGFSIRKMNGRISYRDIDEYKTDFRERYSKNPEEIEEIRNKLQSKSESLNWDIYLENLYACNAGDIAAQCRMIIKKNAPSDCKIYAAWLLGKFGTQEDSKSIWKIYREESERNEYDFGSDDPMKYRNLIDAAENLNGKGNQT